MRRAAPIVGDRTMRAGVVTPEPVNFLGSQSSFVRNPNARRPMGGGGGGGFSMGRRRGDEGRIVARPSARNAEEYYAQRDELTGNPLDKLERNNRERWAAAMATRYGGGAQNLGTGQAAIAGESRFNPETGQWSSGPAAQSISDIEAARVAARAAEEDVAQLQAQGLRQSLSDRAAAASRRAMAAGGSASVTDEMDVPTTIGGLPRDLYWQREANRGMASNVAPLPGFGLGRGGRAAVPYADTMGLRSYLNRLSGLYRGGVR